MTWRRFLAGAVVASGLLVLAAFVTAWRRVPTIHPTPTVELVATPLSNTDYSEVISTHARPYVVEIETDTRGAVLLYGAEHTRDPTDPQIEDIRRRWDAFQPTVALVESRLGIMFPRLMDPVETFAEPGAVHALARRDDVAVKLNTTLRSALGASWRDPRGR